MDDQHKFIYCLDCVQAARGTPNSDELTLLTTLKLECTHTKLSCASNSLISPNQNRVILFAKFVRVRSTFVHAHVIDSCMCFPVMLIELPFFVRLVGDLTRGGRQKIDWVD
jgi:hypothetical protein